MRNFSSIHVLYCKLGQFQKVKNRAFWLGGFKTAAHRKFKNNRQNATYLLKIRFLCHDLTNFQKTFVKSRHDIIE